MKKALLINALIITGTSFLFNTVGISFRVFVSNKIGAEGMGLFQLIVSIYMMATIFVVSGIHIAVTRLVAEEGGRNSFSVSDVLLKKAFIISLFFSITASFILFLGADFIGSDLLQDERTIYSLKILSLSLPFIGIASCIKGYFYAVSKVLRPAISQAIELVVQVFIIINIIDNFAARGLEYACASIVLGTTVSEFASCFYMVMLYRFEQKRNGALLQRKYFQNDFFSKLFRISLPISISSLLRSGLKALENIMIPIGFEKYGYSEKISLEKYGMVHGMAIPILLFPASILSAFSTLLIPEISEANALHQKKRIHYTVNRVLQLTSIMSILVTGIFIIFSNQLGLAIYDNMEIGFMMKILAPLIPIMYLDMVVDALLKGLNQQVSTLKYNLVDSVIRILLIYYLIPANGVLGLILVMYISNLLNTALSISRLLTVSEIKMKVMDWILKPILSVTASGFIVLFILHNMDLGFFSVGIYVTIGVILVSILYVTFLMQLDCLTKEDIKWFKGIFRYSKEVPISSGLLNSNPNSVQKI